MKLVLVTGKMAEAQSIRELELFRISVWEGAVLKGLPPSATFITMSFNILLSK